MPSKKFTPHEYQCQFCGGKIHSTYPGEFVRCGCTKSFVDETEFYTRLGGDLMPKFLGEYKNEVPTPTSL